MKHNRDFSCNFKVSYKDQRDFNINLMYMLQRRTPVLKNTLVCCNECDHCNPGSIILQIQHQQGKHITLPWCRRWQTILKKNLTALVLANFMMKLEVRCCPKSIRIRSDLYLKLSQVFQIQIAESNQPSI